MNKEKFIDWLRQKQKDYPECDIEKLIEDISLQIKDLKEDGMISQLKHVIKNIDPYIDCYLDKYNCDDISDEDYEQLKKYLIELTK